MKCRTITAALLLAGMASTPALAQFHAVVPADRAAMRGTSGLNTLTRDSNQPRTYLMQYPEAQLLAQGLLPGMQITGVTWRANVTVSNTALWPPPGGAIWQNYDITLAQAANPISGMSTTFANNMLNPVVVQMGPLTIPEATFSNDTTLPAPVPNPWGFEIMFSPYTYMGGDLVLHATHDGSNLVSSFSFLDGIASSDLTGRAMTAGAYQAPTGGAATATFTISRLTFIPSPSTGALLAFAGLMAIRRRR